MTHPRKSLAPPIMWKSFLQTLRAEWEVGTNYEDILPSIINYNYCVICVCANYSEVELFGM